jgi:hypothetical protein
MQLLALAVDVNWEHFQLMEHASVAPPNALFVSHQPFALHAHLAFIC